MQTPVSKWASLKIECPECHAKFFVHTAGGDLRTLEHRVKMFLDVVNGKEVRSECLGCKCEHKVSVSRIVSADAVRPGPIVTQ
jgi:hypothetical protein